MDKEKLSKYFKKLYQNTLGGINYQQSNPMKGMQASPGFVDRLNQCYEETLKMYKGDIDLNNTTQVSAELLYSSDPQCLQDVFLVGVKIGNHTKPQAEMVAEFVDTLDDKSDAELASLMMTAFKLSARMWIEAREHCDTAETKELQDNEFANFIKSIL